MPKFRSQSPEYRLFFGIYVRSQDKNLEALKEKLLYIAQNLADEKKKAYANREKAKEVFAPKREAMEYIELLQ